MQQVMQRVMQRVMIIGDSGGLATLPHLLTGTEFETVAALGPGPGVAAALHANHPDLVLIAVDCPDQIVPLLDAINRLEPSPRTVVLAGPSDHAELVTMISRDVRGFLLRENVTPDAAVTLREVLAGGFVIDPAIADHLVASVTRGVRLEGPFGLSRLEEQVLVQLTDDLTNRQIGQRIGVSTSTVKTHVSNILRKLGLRSRDEAAQFAVEHRLG